jgi:hypothetical protein
MEKRISTSRQELLQIYKRLELSNKRRVQTRRLNLWKEEKEEESKEDSTAG